MNLIQTDPVKVKIREIYLKKLKREPELNAIIYYRKKIKRNEITLEELPLILNPKESPKFEQMKKEFNINFFEKKIFSQNGEDGIIDFIFSQIKTTNRFFVEFGVTDGKVCNTRYLLEENGWQGLMMDDSENNPPLIKKEFVTAENISRLFEKYYVPKDFDLLSIDIDFNDYWIWKAIEGYFPRVVVIEYNSSYPPTESKTVPYDPHGRWDRKTNYFGSSLLALMKLGRSKGYTLVGCDSNGVNAFFVKSDLLHSQIKKTINELYKSPNYGIVINGVFVGHQPSIKKLVDV